MRVLLIAPPFGGLDRPSLGLHTLQSVARAAGHAVDIFYANLAFAARLGEGPYMAVSEWGALDLLGERIMGLSLGATLPRALLKAFNDKIAAAAAYRDFVAAEMTLDRLRDATSAWLADCSAAIGGQPYDVIGFSTTFEQTNGAALLARRCRELWPDAVLVIGGANCEGPMARAVKDLIPQIDHVFSGESELAFADFLDRPAYYRGNDIIASDPNDRIDRLPPPDYAEFLRQFDALLPDSINRRLNCLQIPYESSRGCWWGQKHHCTFCGLNGNGIGYREKPAAMVVRELSTLADATGIRKICMTDNIMPFSYFNSVIPQLAAAGLELDIFYEQKANISLEKLTMLKSAGVNRIQPGIEALSDDLLRLMKKGTSGRQNIALLRYARSIGMEVAWNLLSCFPDEQEAWYAETLRLLSLIPHLQPPTGLGRLSIDRFSPYFEQAADYGITGVAPHPSYRAAFPAAANPHDLAYHFVAATNGLTVETSPALRGLQTAIADWQGKWGNEYQRQSPPCLAVLEVADNGFMLIDSRELPGTDFMQMISEEQASVALSLHREDSAATRWGEQRSVCVKVKEGYLPLACAEPSLIQRFERVRAPDLLDVAV